MQRKKATALQPLALLRLVCFHQLDLVADFVLPTSRVLPHFVRDSVENLVHVIKRPTFVADGQTGVQILDVTTPSSPAPNSNVERITVQSSILCCDLARIFLLGHESRAGFMRNITLRNLDIVHFSMTPFLLEPSEDMRLEDITIEDIRIHGEGQREFIRLRPVVNQYMRKKVPRFIRNVRFKNVTVHGRSGDYLVQIQGADTEHNVRDVTFENVSIVDSKLTEESKRVRIGKHTKDARFHAEVQ